MKCGNYVTEIIDNENSQIIEAVSIHFHPEILEQLFNDTYSKNIWDTVSNLDSQIIKLDSNQLFDLFVEGLMFYFQNPKLVDEEILKLKLKELILILTKTQNRQKLKSIFIDVFSPEIKSFKAIIEAQLFSGLTLSDLAYLTNKSLSTFKRDFKKYYHTTPSHYIKNRKLEKAAQLLHNSNLRITDIAFDCGFKTLAHFTKSFHQNTIVHLQIIEYERI